ncbi:response regulator transcription factor [Xinfangfangia sp. D13-10-4-6]|uniref:response regulator n=1 Tax=Pseudogemmobacter hezensis TaxID=2737662 RepID=UPI0015569FE5|nr:response regulator transcription factor [Pseudogemmobacter hezensis]NPD16082.1 response regulator transcription factor [Pseudogemmobacter hezensis]
MSERQLILIVDDEPQIQRFLVHALGASGYDTALAANGAEALAAVAQLRPDLMILDLGLPDMNGKTVIERLRADSDLPVIVLSAHDQEMEKILALDLGANDFVAKPFAIGELLARLRASLRPKRGAGAQALLRSGDLTLSRDLRQVFVGAEEVRLTPKEFDLLLALLEQPDRIVTHRQLLLRVWGPAHVADVAYLRVFIGQLRQKLEAVGFDASAIRTEAGIGYRWINPT